jgi:hypothetical protein
LTGVYGLNSEVVHYPSSSSQNQLAVMLSKKSTQYGSMVVFILSSQHTSSQEGGLGQCSAGMYLMPTKKDEGAVWLWKDLQSPCSTISLKTKKWRLREAKGNFSFHYL